MGLWTELDEPIEGVGVDSDRDGTRDLDEIDIKAVGRSLQLGYEEEREGVHGWKSVSIGETDLDPSTLGERLEDEIDSAHPRNSETDTYNLRVNVGPYSGKIALPNIERVVDKFYDTRYGDVPDDKTRKALKPTMSEERDMMEKNYRRKIIDGEVEWNLDDIDKLFGKLNLAGRAVEVFHPDKEEWAEHLRQEEERIKQGIRDIYLDKLDEVLDSRDISGDPDYTIDPTENEPTYDVLVETPQDELLIKFPADYMKRDEDRRIPNLLNRHERYFGTAIPTINDISSVEDIQEGFDQRPTLSQFDADEFLHEAYKYTSRHGITSGHDITVGVMEFFTQEQGIDNYVKVGGIDEVANSLEVVNLEIQEEMKWINEEEWSDADRKHTSLVSEHDVRKKMKSRGEPLLEILEEVERIAENN